MTFVSDPLVERVIGCAIAVHRELGPGLLENVYQRCLCIELASNQIPFTTQVPVPVFYRGQKVDVGYRIDLIVDNWLVLEVKSVEHLLPIHSAQVLTYVKLAHARQGLLLNFNAPTLRQGLKSLLLRSPSLPSIPSTQE